MRLQRSFLLVLLLGSLLWAGVGFVQARDRDARDYVRSMRSGARELLTLTQGSVHLDVKPKDAQVFVDGRYYGIVRDFNDKRHPLFLYPGRHLIELRYDRHRPAEFPVTLRPEQDIHIKFKMQKY